MKKNKIKNLLLWLFLIIMQTAPIIIRKIEIKHIVFISSLVLCTVLLYALKSKKAVLLIFGATAVAWIVYDLQLFLVFFPSWCLITSFNFISGEAKEKKYKGTAYSVFSVLSIISSIGLIIYSFINYNHNYTAGDFLYLMKLTKMHFWFFLFLICMIVLYRDKKALKKQGIPSAAAGVFTEIFCVAFFGCLSVLFFIYQSGFYNLYETHTVFFGWYVLIISVAVFSQDFILKKLKQKIC